MSQRNMSKRRQEKILKKQKQQKKIAIILIIVVILACLAGIGWVFYDKSQQEKAKQEAEALKKKQMEISRQETDSANVNVDSILEYLGGLDTELLNKEITVYVDAATGEAVSSESVSAE